MTKKLTSAGLVLGALLVALLFWIASRHEATEQIEGQIRIAALLTLTGPPARFDAVKQNTLDVAMQRIGALYPNVDLSLRYFDAGAGPDVTLAAVQRAQNWGASVYLSGTSPNALSIASVVRGSDPVVAQLANAANPEFGPPREGEYRFWPDWNQEAETIWSVVLEEKMSRLLLIHSADPYSESLAAAFRARSDVDSAMELSTIRYDPAATPDFRPALIRAQSEGVDVVIVFGLPPGIRALFTQMAEVGWEDALIGGVNINLAVGDFDNAGLTGSLWLVQTEAMLLEMPADSEAAAFRSLYKEAHDVAPPFHALYLADALYMVAIAEHSADDDDSANIVDKLGLVSDFQSASGEIVVAPDRVLQFRMEAVRVR